MGRRASRELAMKLLYQLEIQKDDREDQKNRFFEDNTLAEKDRAYINDVVDGVFSRHEVIDNMIEVNSKGWKIGRISKVDLSIMRLSIYEICFRNDIPLNVSINEAVELAKKYSNEDAGSFVNGILSKIRAEGSEPAESIDQAELDSVDPVKPSDPADPEETKPSSVPSDAKASGVNGD